MRKPMLAWMLLAALLGGIWSAAAQGSKSAPALPEPTIKVGDIAPDFTLKDQNGKEVSLHDFRGKKSVVLAFYVFAFTGG
jgi:cytochrome oxidase Cu insertion factor (SCO1/SenC/PrrC family)